MSIIKIPAPLVALTAFILFAPALAQAQDQRFRVSFAPAVATVGGDAELALGGTFGYRFSEHFWFEGDLTWIDAAAGGFRDRNFEFDGRVANASDLADLVRRRAGMFGGGLPGGIGFPILPNIPKASTSAGCGRLPTAPRWSARWAFAMNCRCRPSASVRTSRAGSASTIPTRSSSSTRPRSRLRSTRRSRTPATAFNAGAGASVRLAGQFWADVDARYFRLSRDRDIMRLGGGVSFRF